VVGDPVVGDAVVGAVVVGDTVVSDTVVGELVGASVVREEVVGKAVVGDPVVGDAVVGEAVVGGYDFYVHRYSQVPGMAGRRRQELFGAFILSNTVPTCSLSARVHDFPHLTWFLLSQLRIGCRRIRPF
jgi:hypothetical protein